MPLILPLVVVGKHAHFTTRSVVPAAGPRPLWSRARFTGVHVVALQPRHYIFQIPSKSQWTPSNSGTQARALGLGSAETPCPVTPRSVASYDKASSTFSGETDLPGRLPMLKDVASWGCVADP
ncbi:hypothetical protein DXG01_016770 [Tephrocybe rancida]|nr:hypothetical protein DXG01_016770 [Tephrocybe rancida]